MKNIRQQLTEGGGVVQYIVLQDFIFSPTSGRCPATANPQMATRGGTL
jgi:hypothetical protein